MDFEIISEISQIDTIAANTGIRENKRLSEQYGSGRWRKLKGMANVRLLDGAYVLQRFIGMRLTESERENSN